MTRKEEYALELKDPRWIALRDEKLRRGLHQCEECGKETGLHVHHKEYRSGAKAWEYSLDDLQVLCATHHEWAHTSQEYKDLLTEALGKFTVVGRV